MSRKMKYFLVVLGVFVAGFSFSLFTSGRVSADPVDSNRKPLLVEILNLPLAITGAVSVDNLPVDEASNSLRTTSPAERLRDGWGVIDPDTNNHQLIVPAGVALTDVVLYRDSSSGFDSCLVWLHATGVSGGNTLLYLEPSAANPLAELHFESGLRSTPEREIKFVMISHCEVRVLWTGYEY